MPESKEDPEKMRDCPEEKKTTWPQWLATFTGMSVENQCTCYIVNIYTIVSLAVLVSGMANGWLSPYLAQLTSAEAGGSMKLTDVEASWVASLLNLGRLAGSLVCAICQEYAGRKTTLLLGGLPMAISWILSICATSAMWLHLSRFASGIGSGIVWAAIALYIGEIADPSIRSSLISVLVNVASVGLFLGNVMGPYLSMETFAYVSLVPNILFLGLFSFIPESPYHYVLHGQTEKAEASLRWFSRKTDVKAEMRELQDFVDGADTGIMTKLKEFVQPGNLKQIMVLFVLNVFVFMSGYAVINAYAEIIVRKAGVSLTPSAVVIGLGFSTIVAGSTTVLLIDKLGKKCLLVVASIGGAISLGLLGLHFHLLSLGFDPHGLTWLPITSLLTFNLFVYYGFIPMPSSFLGEMFPLNLKNLASFILSGANALLSFMVTKTYQPYVNLVGEKYVFWTYSLITILCVPFVLFCLTENKGKSLLEIQNSTKK